MKIAYCDCFSGISGDMFLGALIDAGVPLAFVQDQVNRLGISEQVELRLDEVRKGALRSAQLQVKLAPGQPSPHRHLSDIAGLIDASALGGAIKERAKAVFTRLAAAEAKVHGTSIDEVHFHEVGAVDAIVDIVGAAAGLAHLGVERLFASALPMASGQVETQHGPLPLPAPATLELMRAARAPVVPSTARVELVTPTGAAILAELAVFEQPAMRITGLGIGAGQRDLPWPNVLRLIVGESDAAPAPDLVLLETNIDDMNPQVFGYVMAKLLAAGALDVYFTPIHMKKNRPATMLSAIARRGDEAALVRVILTETSTLGVRVSPIQRRYEAGRRMETVQTPYGAVSVKLKIVDGKTIQAAPEYDVCAQLAAERGATLMQVYTESVAAAMALIDH